MKTAVPLVVGLFVLLACSSLRPVPIASGDICEGCKRPITDAKVAAEIVAPNGLAMKFRTVSCLARYMNEHQADGSGVFVTDYNSGRFLSAHSAMFVRTRIDENTGERDYAAFGDVASAVEFGKANGSSPVDWPSVIRQTAATN